MINTVYVVQVRLVKGLPVHVVQVQVVKEVT